MKKLFCAALAFLFFLPTVTIAQSQFLDLAFGVNGRFTHVFIPGVFSRLWCTAPQPDGKIIGGGATGAGISSYRAAILRTNTNGTLDPSFASGGAWISDDPAFGFVYKVIVQPDGKILITGSSAATFKVVRLMPDGTYDTSFGTGGKVSFPVWGDTGVRDVYDMILRPDGKILVTGKISLNSDEIMVTRLRANGSLDPTFGTGGTVKIHRSLFNSNSISSSLRLALLPDNKVLLAVYASDSTNAYGNFILRYSITGTLDTGFGTNGVVRSHLTHAVAGLFLLPDNSFYFLSTITHNIIKPALYKYKPDGSVDSSFADNGVASFVFNSKSCSPRNGFLQSDGKVIVFGGNINGIGFLGRFNADGSLDTSFGIGGTLEPLTLFENFYEGFVQPDGKIIAAGRYQDTTGANVCSILRYLGANSGGLIDAPSAVSAPLIYPNPVSAEAVSIAYELPDASPVSIELLDMQGKILGTLLRTDRPQGKNEENLNLPAGLGDGFYLLNIQTNKGNAVVKLVLRRP